LSKGLEGRKISSSLDGLKHMGSPVLEPREFRAQGESWCNYFHDENDQLKLGNPPCTIQQPTVDDMALVVLPEAVVMEPDERAVAVEDRRS
jgi:hypothetical protein